MISFAKRGWPRTKIYPGLAHGPEGWLWAWRQGIEAGLLREDPRLLRSAKRWLKLNNSGNADCGSLFIGSAARPLVFVRLAREHAELWRAWPGITGRWRRAIGKSNKRDLMLGSAGALLACVEIEALTPGRLPREIAREFQVETLQGLRRHLARARSGEHVYVGLAHGFAGYLLSLEMARAGFGFHWDASVRSECLDFLARERREGPAHASVWRFKTGVGDGALGGWCHGSPGIGLALLACYQVTKEIHFWQLAEQALNGMFLGPPQSDSFCCGRVGQSQILIEAYRVTGNSRWMALARDRAITPIKGNVRDRALSRGFHKGSLGRAYLNWRLLYPKRLALPGLGLLSAQSADGA
jgi:hypothetical protein